MSATPTAVSFLAERTREAAPGIAGGEDGETGEVRINDARVDAKQQHIVRQGDTILLRTPGGGGYGPAAARDPDAVEADAVKGLIASETEAAE